MKNHLANVLLASLLPLMACDQQKSGPVQPEATPAAETTQTRETATAQDLFVAQGPKSSISVGTATPIELTITPSTGFKINKRFEWSFEFHPSADVEIPQPSVKLDEAHLDDAHATIPLNVTAKNAGDLTLTATANFSVCNDDKCELYRDREVTFTMAATDG